MPASLRDCFFSFVTQCSTGLFALVCLLTLSPVNAAEQKPSQEQIQFFESKIRPLLIKHCYDCHGEDAQESDLRVDTFDGIAKGGKAGSLIVPGKPEQSLLITAVNYQSNDLQMPPDEKLSKQEIKDLSDWVKMGAPYPNADLSKLRAASDKGKYDLEKEREFWSFQPVRNRLYPKSKIKHGSKIPSISLYYTSWKKQGCSLPHLPINGHSFAGRPLI